MATTTSLSTPLLQQKHSAPPSQAARSLLLLALMLTLCGCGAAPEDNPIQNQPNILLIVADDLGYTDIGVLGSEIPTPNIDKLAASGMLLSNFYVSPGCSPTRAMMLSGTDNHLAGLGSLHELLADNQRGQPGYQGYLAEHIVTLPEILRHYGYRTYMAGKWHLGPTEDLAPNQRGFDHSFALLEGGASHFGDQTGIGPSTPRAHYRSDGRLVDVPQDFYSTYFYTDTIINYLQEDRADERPFFAYLAYTAPHWPLHAPEEWLAQFRGRYDVGYDAIRERRIRQLNASGLFRPFTTLPSESELAPRWSELNNERRTDMARRMEVYAAMVAALDDQIGKLLDYLRSQDKLENTLILFFSDNGPDFTLQDQHSRIANWVQGHANNSLANMGKPGSFISYGSGWAQASSGPLRLFKGTTAEGGVRSPLIAFYPGHFPAGTHSTALSSVMDILPTVLSAANIPYPKSLGNRPTQRLRGESMLPALTGRQKQIHQADYVLGMELLDGRALWQGDWKLLNVFPPLGSGRWQLYNITQDSGELQDLSDKEPERLNGMREQYEAWTNEVGVIEPAGGSPLTQAMLGKH